MVGTTALAAREAPSFPTLFCLKSYTGRGNGRCYQRVL
jgi:hypothetical protein